MLEMSGSKCFTVVIHPLSTALIKPNFCFHLSHQRSTTVSLETRNPSKFLEAVAFNSNIIEGFFLDHNPPGKRKRDLAAFREDLILQLLRNWRAEKGKPKRKRQSDPFRLENVGEHLPIKGKGPKAVTIPARCAWRRGVVTLSVTVTPQRIKYRAK